MRTKLEEGISNLKIIAHSVLLHGHIYISISSDTDIHINNITQNLLALLNNNTTTTWNTYKSKRISQPRNNKSWPNKLITDIPVCAHHQQAQTQL